MPEPDSPREVTELQYTIGVVRDEIVPALWKRAPIGREQYEASRAKREERRRRRSSTPSGCAAPRAPTPDPSGFCDETDPPLRASP